MSFEFVRTSSSSSSSLTSSSSSSSSLFDKCIAVVVNIVAVIDLGFDGFYNVPTQ